MILIHSDLFWIDLAWSDPAWPSSRLTRAAETQAPLSLGGAHGPSVKNSSFYLGAQGPLPKSFFAYIYLFIIQFHTGFVEKPVFSNEREARLNK